MRAVGIVGVGGQRRMVNDRPKMMIQTRLSCCYFSFNIGVMPPGLLHPRFGLVYTSPLLLKQLSLRMGPRAGQTFPALQHMR